MGLRTIRRRRKEGKTDYKARLSMLKSGMPRIAIRKSNRYISIQLIESEAAVDKVIMGFNSKELLKKGWPKEKTGSLSSLPAAYLTGFLFGKKVLKDKEKTGAIVDLGLYRSIRGSKLYAAVKGVADSGFDVKCEESVFPSKERLLGNEDTQKIVKQIKDKAQ